MFILSTAKWCVHSTVRKSTTDSR